MSSSEESSEDEESIARAPYPAPVPAPAPAPMPIARAPVPVPAPLSVAPYPDRVPESQPEAASMPMPQPQPTAPSTTISIEPQPMTPVHHTISETINHDEEPQQSNDHHHNALVVMNGDDKPPPHTKLTAAAELIHTLDTAAAQANAATAATALDAEKARISARTAAEIVRRYTTGSHPREGTAFDDAGPLSPQLKLQHHASTPVAISAGRAPMSMSINTSSFFSSTADNHSQTDNTNNNHNSNNGSKTPNGNNNNNNHRTAITPMKYHFPKTPPSTASLIANSHVEDSLSLSLELERAKQALEGERMAHDETKNILAEERSKKNLVLQKLQRLESNMETQRETIGRSEDALEEELERTRFRMEAAEEDAQLALDFAKESQEGREKCEEMLEEAMAEIQSLREQLENMAFYTVEASHHSEFPQQQQQQGYYQQQQQQGYYQQQEGSYQQQQPQEGYYDSGNNTDGGYYPAEEQQQQEYQPQPEAEHPQEQPEDAQPQPPPQYEEQEYQEQEPPPTPTAKQHLDQSNEGTPKHVHFSDPISFSKSPSEDSFEPKEPPLQEIAAPAVDMVEMEALDEEPLSPLEEDAEFGMPTTTPITTTTPTRPARPLVSAGRKLLQKSTGKDYSVHVDDMTYSFEFTPEKSAERRQRLRDQLKQLDSTVVIPTPDRTPPPQQKHLQFTTNFYDLCKNAAEIIKASGHRLELDGQWFREATFKESEEEETTHLDTLAKQYCQSVEVKISRQKSEITELESLCSFLEESVANAASTATDDYGADSGGEGKWNSSWT
ncbi:expressed unknown protein [Seminavis robusta]|uniref:Uncharacterized protein n=1 Tax=Seminavis robusta TaxID=568900 RepID=A0A9N8HUN1_9STRA|nr:expressed unknown protein [Seminavis robusta]|eukprot:Sro2121_g315460.1 n/a (784) ;mRNA; f:7032-9473